MPMLSMPPHSLVYEDLSNPHPLASFRFPPRSVGYLPFVLVVNLTISLGKAEKNAWQDDRLRPRHRWHRPMD